MNTNEIRALLEDFTAEEKQKLICFLEDLKHEESEPNQLWNHAFNEGVRAGLKMAGMKEIEA